MAAGLSAELPAKCYDRAFCSRVAGSTRPAMASPALCCRLLATTLWHWCRHPCSSSAARHRIAICLHVASCTAKKRCDSGQRRPRVEPMQRSQSRAFAALHQNSVGAVSDRDFGFTDITDSAVAQYRRRRRLPQVEFWCKAGRCCTVAASIELAGGPERQTKMLRSGGSIVVSPRAIHLNT
jgi:hypothetical protein